MSVKVTDFCSVFSTAECGKDLEQNSNTERSGSLRISNIYLTFCVALKNLIKVQ